MYSLLIHGGYSSGAFKISTSSIRFVLLHGRRHESNDWRFPILTMMFGDCWWVVFLKKILVTVFKNYSNDYISSIFSSDPKHTMIGLTWNEESHILTITPPDAPVGQEVPTNVIAVVDTSGSMGSRVSFKNSSASGEDVETNYSVLDLVKYSLKVVTSSMSGDDTFGLVTFSTEAKVVIKHAPLSDIDELSGKIDAMHPSGMTNLWAGVKCAIEMAGDTNTTIMVFTDGLPNSHPPSGYDSVYDGTRLKGGGSIHTFGFGNDLSVDILFSMARHYNGTYNYISDSSMIGTTFCYSIANIKAQMTDRVLINGTGNVGQLIYGQPRHVLLPERPHQVDICDVTYNGVVDGPVEDATFHKERYAIGDMFLSLVNCCDKGCKTALVEDLVEMMKSSVTSEDLLDDINGELTKAVANNAFQSWGRYYIPSLFCCHERERANNFMDVGTQRYATGYLFKQYMDKAAQAFDDLEVQKPSLMSHIPMAVDIGNPYAANGVTMSQAFMCAANGCVAGTTNVVMDNGTTRQVQELVPGDVLEDGNIVTHVVVGAGAWMHYINSWFYATPWHPIKRTSTSDWTFPHDIVADDAQPRFFSRTWNLVTSKGSFSTPTGERVITLGHGIEDDPVASHPYLGSKRVVDDVGACYDEETRTCRISRYKRDFDTGLICGVYK